MRYSAFWWLDDTDKTAVQDCQYWLRYLSQQCTLHEIRHKRRITVAAASKILANLTYAYKGMGLSMGTMLAGVCFDPFIGKCDGA
jgi:20S proteasome alpha/beta subunit